MSVSKKKYKADFLWGKEGALEVALYEFANCGTEEYREAQYKIIKALATPTFSGEDKPFNEKYGLEIGGKFIPFKDLPTDITELRKLIDKSTEQKEYCNCSNRQVMYGGTLTQEQIDRLPCVICGKPKPIPAEKKECEHEWELYSASGGGWHISHKGSYVGHFEHHRDAEEFLRSKETKPEPKPKERIDKLTDSDLGLYPNKQCGVEMVFKNKINEIIHFINNRK